MRTVIFTDKMIQQLKDSGETKGFWDIKPQPPSNMIWDGWLLSTTGNQKDVGKAIWVDSRDDDKLNPRELKLHCPYARPPEIRRVREAWYRYPYQEKTYYRADHPYSFHIKWNSPVLMPPDATRFFVKCTAVEAIKLHGTWSWICKYTLVQGGTS